MILMFLLFRLDVFIVLLSFEKRSSQLLCFSKLLECLGFLAVSWPVF